MCFGLSVLRNLLEACLMLLVVLLVCFARMNFSFFQRFFFMTTLCYGFFFGSFDV